VEQVSVSEHGMSSRDATEVSDHDSFGFQAIVGAIRQVRPTSLTLVSCWARRTHTDSTDIFMSIRFQTQPGTMVAPSLFIAGTDSKHFTTVARKRIYRYLSSKLYTHKQIIYTGTFQANYIHTSKLYIQVPFKQIVNGAGVVVPNTTHLPDEEYL
jgi:hypothetical protein